MHPLLRLQGSATIASTRPSISTTTFICSQCRHATLLRRPKRPYTFTQLITLSDGSTFTHRTTSPAPVYRTTRDTRNSLLWNPSSNKLQNVEADDAGRLAAFRARFGRSWDASSSAVVDGGEMESETAASAGDLVEKKKQGDQKAKQEAAAAAQQQEHEEEDNLLDLISSFGQEEAQADSKKKKKKE